MPDLESLRNRYDKATAELDPPLALANLDAFDANAADLARRARNLPVRLATKSVRCRALIARALALDAFRGLMCYSLREALWLHAEGASDDILVGYPTVDAAALRQLARDDAARQHVTVMVDEPAHLDLIDRVRDSAAPEFRVCLELDVSWRPVDRVHIGARRSPLHAPSQARDFAEQIARR
ncbi:MAG TPA: alanine racemase, partial [Streptosporangiaceae bacterium]|nr:alanine racemase [Streptosporangiaceae bacterium]